MKLFIIILASWLSFAVPVAVAEDDAVNINTADAAELAAALNGVGDARARAIIEHREQFGPFSSVDELRYVQGIGSSTLERNRERMTVGEADGERGTADAGR